MNGNNNYFQNSGNKSGGPVFKVPNMGDKNLIGIIVVAIFALLICTQCFEMIDSKERGLLKYMGKVDTNVLDPGINFTIPFISKISTVNISTQKMEVDGIKIYTKDQQTAEVTITMTYSISPTKIVEMYEKIGSINRQSLNDTILMPILKSSITNELGKWTAEEVIINKEKISNQIFSNLSNEMQKDGGVAIISNIEILSIDLDDDYERATREKVIAEQKAQTAKNQTRQIEEEAKQQIIQAEAEAKSMRIRSQALSANKSLVEYEAVQKWDGKLPQYMTGSGSIPFININSK